MIKLFDLNVEQVLEHWEPEHALREIIANALDEQILTNSKPIEVYQTEGKWHIRDYGRGLQHKHFTQNENNEKLESPFLIGKFGVGLKDALAVFYRKGINVEIDSKYAHVTLTMANKLGFDIETLHASFDGPKDRKMEGTDFVISGIGEDAFVKAKSMFLYFNTSAVLAEKTRYGEVYYREESISSIYINGVRVATENNFLFTYNITNINAQIKKALNRERSNVGRAAYSDTVKNILRQCKSDSVLLALIKDLENVMRGTNKDESGWVDISTYAATTLNRSGKAVFMTPLQRAQLTNQQVEILNQSGKHLIMITDNVFSKIAHSVITFNEVYDEYERGFKYNFVDPRMLTQKEKQVFSLKEIIITFLKSHGYKYKAQIKISETIKIDVYGGSINAIWDPQQNAIILKRNILSSRIQFLGTLAHEFAHFHSGYEDNTREFENVLTEMLGYALSSNTVDNRKLFIEKFFKR